MDVKEMIEAVAEGQEVSTVVEQKDTKGLNVVGNMLDKIAIQLEKASKLAGQFEDKKLKDTVRKSISSAETEVDNAFSAIGQSIK